MGLVWKLSFCCHSKVNLCMAFFPHWISGDIGVLPSYNTSILQYPSLKINLYGPWTEIFSVWWSNSDFWPLVECILQIPLDLGPLKIPIFSAHLDLCNKQYSLLSHLNSCLTVLQNLEKSKNDRTPSFWGIDLPYQSIQYTGVFLASCATI